MMPPMRRAPRALLSILAAAPLLVGAPALAQSPAPVQVLDVEWTLSQLDGEAVPDDPAITATFASDGTLTGSGGCNDYSATWTATTACSSRSPTCSPPSRPAPTMSTHARAATSRSSRPRRLEPRRFGRHRDHQQRRDPRLRRRGRGPRCPRPRGRLDARDGRRQAPPAGMVVTLSIGADGTLTGVACNAYNAGYTATETGDLTIDPIIATRMSCGDEQDAFEFTYLDGLQGATGWGTQIGKLTIFGAAELVFGDGSAADATLTGQEWSLATIGGAPLPAGSGITAAFGEDGTVTGSGGCNGYTGPYTVDGESLSVGPLAATRMSCGQSPMTSSARTLARSRLATGFAIGGTDLVISTSNGVTLEFSASSGPVEPSRLRASAPGRAERASGRAERASGRAAAPAASHRPRRPRPAPRAAVAAGDIVGSLDDDQLCRLGPARRHARHRHHVRRGRHLLRLRRLQRLFGPVVAERHQPVHQRLRGRLVGHL